MVVLRDSRLFHLAPDLVRHQPGRVWGGTSTYTPPPRERMLLPPSGTPSAPSAPKGHLGAQSSPLFKMLVLPLYSCYQAHDLWVPKCTYCSKTRFERPNAFWSPRTIDFTSENIRAGALASFWSEKCSNRDMLVTWSVLTENARNHQ